MAAQETSVRLSLPLGVGATGEVERLDGNSIMPRWARVARASRTHTRHVQVLSSWMRGTASSVAETRAGSAICETGTRARSGLAVKRLARGWAWNGHGTRPSGLGCGGFGVSGVGPWMELVTW
jgi:hypothetical protein